MIYTVEVDSIPTSQQDEESRIATLAHALKKLGNPEDAAEFMRRLNAICEEGDARYPQVATSYYYGEIAERDAGSVLNDLGSPELLAQEARQPSDRRIAVIGKALASRLAETSRNCTGLPKVHNSLRRL